MKRVRRLWLLLLILTAIPYLLLFLAGSIWLYERGLLWHFLAISGLLMLLGLPIMQWLRARNRARLASTAADAETDAAFGSVTPDPNWSPTARKAWERVGQISRDVQTQDLPLDDPQAIWQVLYRVLDAVAREFHPGAKEPSLEIPVPHVLRAVELVARDLREAFSENVPGAHILTVGDMGRLKRLAGWMQHFNSLYRLISAGFNPYSAILRGIRDAASDSMVATSTGEVRQWAVGFCVRKAGYYAIQLYNGQLVLDEVAFQQFETDRTKHDLQRSESVVQRLSEEPLRVLVLGQVKSGKSSLVNALFGETRAAVDVVPRTRGVDPYVLERDGIPRAIILDTAGYEEGNRTANPFETFKEHVLNCDLVLVVVSVRSASRAADRLLLDELRAFFQRQPDRILPPIVVALTHIDEIRPRTEWNPPYDLAQPSTAKAANILDAIRAVEEDLALGPDQVVVPVCLKGERMYNVEEALAPAIFNAVPEAQRVRYLRCLRHFHEADYWQRLWKQTLSAGRILVKAGSEWASQKMGP